MKKSFAILMFCVSLSFIAVRNETNAQTPLDFQGSLIYNPVLVHGETSSWEELTIFSPYAFIHEDTVYIFYSGINSNWKTSIGMATSADGYTFTKYPDNPVFDTSGSGFDSYHVAGGIVIEDQTGFVMYYNGREVPGYGPGPYVGRATATKPSGPWTRNPNPVLTVGSPDEWDADFIASNNIFPLDTGGYIMFYSAGNDFSSGMDRQIGMATSEDGITWTKYNDPATTDHPFAESDPVLKPGDPGQWDAAQAYLCSILKKQDGYEMYYTGSNSSTKWTIGYASSPDGISWTKDPSNPVYTINDDPYAVLMGYPPIVESPAIVMNGSVAFMYYDYGIVYPGEIGMATAYVPPNPGINDKKITNYELRITNYPNPVAQSTTFTYKLKESGHATIQIFNSFGQMVAEPVNARQSKGEQKVTWDVGNLPAGIFCYRIQAGNEVGGGKMVVVK